MSKKCLIVASVASMIDKFNMPNIELLQSMGYRITVAANFSFGNIFDDEHARELWEKLSYMDVEVHDVKFPRSVLSNLNIKAFKQLKELISKNKYSLIHCHTPIGGAIARLAARKARRRGTKVIYTAHGFHFYKGAPLKNWIIYYPAEKILARYTDALITINQEDYRRAKQKIKAKSVYYIHGIGVNTNKFADSNIDRETKRSELDIPVDATVMMSIGELNTNKNHQVVIKALGEIKDDNLHYIICGKGDQLENLRELSSSMNLSKRVHFLGYRTDIVDLCYCADIFCFPSKREGLGIAAVEAMLCGLPIITSNVHGINDYSDNGVTGFSCSPTDVSGFATAISKLASNSEMRQKMGEFNRKKALIYDVKNTMKITAEIYESVFDK